MLFIETSPFAPGSISSGLRPRCRQEENYDDDDSADQNPLPESGFLLRIMLRHNLFHVSAGKPTGLFGGVDLSGAELADERALWDFPHAEFTKLYRLRPRFHDQSSAIFC
jgi:hypothetical protein